MNAHLKYHVMETCFNGMSLKKSERLLSWTWHCINESEWEP